MSKERNLNQNQRFRTRPKNILGVGKYWIGLSCLMAGIALGIGAFSFYKQPKLVAFDLKATTDNFLQQLQNTSLDEREKAKTVKRFELALNEVIAEYKENNTIVFVKAAVISPVPDKTNEIKKKISQRMKQVNE